MFALNVVAGKLAQPELTSVIADLREAQLPADRLKVCIVGLSQGSGEVHLRTAAQAYFGGTGHDVLAERGEGHSQLDGRAGLRAFGESQLLVHHGQDASAGRINGHDGAVHVAQSINGSLADRGIFARVAVAFGDVSGKGTGRKVLVVAPPATCKPRPPVVTQPGQSPPGARTFNYLRFLLWEFGGCAACAGEAEQAGQKPEEKES